MHKKNNFDFLRLLLSSMVVIAHAYPLSGLPDYDILCSLTNGQLSFAYLSVRGFFIISGYLIFQSFERSRNIGDYYWKRILRLFPALFVVLLLIVLLAPFVYQSHNSYLLNKSVWTYLPNNISLYRIQYNIDGVFENNFYPAVINGSLWTIPYEFTMYVVISFLFIFNNKKRQVAFALTLLFLIMLAGNLFFIRPANKFKISGFEGGHFLDLGIYFIAGSLLSVFNFDAFKYKNLVIIGAAVLLVSSIYFQVFAYTKLITLPLLIITFGLQSTSVINNIGSSIGDLSYGIYIYSFPVQQTLMYYNKFNYIELMLYGAVVSYCLAFLSWHLVEKKALQLKKLNPSKLFVKYSK